MNKRQFYNTKNGNSVATSKINDTSLTYSENFTHDLGCCSKFLQLSVNNKKQNANNPSPSQQI